MTYIFAAIYDVVYKIGLLCSLPIFGKRLFGRDGKYHDFFQRCGIYDREIISRVKQKKIIWIHTVSIGELLASLPLIGEISSKFSNYSVIVSCVSRTGRLIAEEKLPEDIIKIFLPFDFSLTVELAMMKLNPEIFISIETEIWPNLFRVLKRKNIPIIILNGRISQRSFKRYLSVKFLIKRIISSVDLFVMRSRADAERIILLGAEKKKVSVTKSIKFDQAYYLSLSKKSPEIEKFNGPTVVFGSIHRGEEQGVVEIASKIIEKYRDINIVIVPRALDRTNIFNLLEERGLLFERFSSKKTSKFLVVDRYGVLTEFYRICDIAYVGGALVPAGGQNPLEPLAFKKPVIYGKFHWDFEEEWDLILKAEAGFEVNSFDECLEKIEFLLNNPEICSKMGESGYKMIYENKGATAQMLELVENRLISS